MNVKIDTKIVDGKRLQRITIPLRSVEEIQQGGFTFPFFNIEVGEWFVHSGIVYIKTGDIGVDVTRARLYYEETDEEGRTYQYTANAVCIETGYPTCFSNDTIVELL